MAPDSRGNLGIWNVRLYDETIDEAYTAVLKARSPGKAPTEDNESEPESEYEYES